MNYGLMYKLPHKLNNLYLSSTVSFSLDQVNDEVRFSSKSFLTKEEVLLSKSQYDFHKFWIFESVDEKTNTPKLVGGPIRWNSLVNVRSATTGRYICSDLSTTQTPTDPFRIEPIYKGSAEFVRNGTEFRLVQNNRELALDEEELRDDIVYHI